MIRHFIAATLMLPFLLLTGSAEAQITIESSAVGSLVGTTVEQTSFSSDAGQSAAIEALYNQSGADRMWDFTTLSWTSDGTVSTNYVALPADLPASDDPRVADANYAIQFFEPPNQEDFQIVLYRQLMPTGNYSFGSYVVIEEGTTDQLYEEPLLENPFPLSFGMDPWEGMTSYSTEFEVEGQVFTRTVVIETDGEITGWGTLRLPGQDPIDVLRLEETRTETSTISGVPGQSVTQSTRATFVSSSLTNASISLSPDGTGGTTMSASYAVFGGGGGGTEPPADAPGNLDPADGATNVATDVTLTWEEVPFGDTYYLQVSTDVSFSKKGSVDLIVDESGLTSPEYNVTGLDNAVQYFWRVRAENEGGAGPWSATQSFTTVASTSIEARETETPAAFALVGNYPNPFNPVTTITFDVAESVPVRVTVHDMLGRELDVLADRTFLPGRYDVTWEAGDRPSGSYVVRLETESLSAARTIVLLK